MYIPLHIRLTLFCALVLALALWFFGNTTYSQAEQRAYKDLQDTLRSRAASVQLGKFLLSSNAGPDGPAILPSVDGLGTGGVAVEVFAVSGNQFRLLATTTPDQTRQDFSQTTVTNLGSSPIPWDEQALHKVARYEVGADGVYSTITYQGQCVLVYTLLNPDSLHIIQTAHSEQDIEQSLDALRSLLIRGGVLAMLLVLAGGWFISWRVLTAVRGMTSTAQIISTSRDFGKRVPSKAAKGQDELAALAATFNQMLASLEEAYQRQQRFVADASHELRAPITAIRCNLDLLAKAQDLPPEERLAALADARTEAERMGRLVNDLLLLAHADSVSQANTTNISNRRGNAQAQEVDLDSLLLGVFRQYRPLEDNGQKLQGPRLLLQHTTPAKVYGDADQLKQAIVALVDNALKYTPHEGYVSLSLSVAEHYAVVKVSDTGIGIAPKDLPHIFERFYRADHARIRNRGGSGLGLAIVQSIAQEHRGRIEVKSTPGKGSIFMLKVPIIKVV